MDKALPQLLLSRVYLETETLGSIYDSRGGLICKSMELPWKDNQHNVSCIPEGEYEVTKEPPIQANDPAGRHERPYYHFRLHGVHKRDGILMHRITFVKDLKGCIGIVGKFFDLNKDGVPDAVESGKTLQAMTDTLPNRFRILIEERDKIVKPV